MSMISEQIEQLEGLKETILKSTLPYYECERQARIIRSAVDTIKELSAKLHAAQMERSSQYYNGGWIPCEERLPEENGAYLVQAFQEDMFKADFDRDYKKFGFHTDVFDPETLAILDIKWIEYAGEIIAWRPLPEPYQPKESEEQVNERD